MICSKLLKNELEKRIQNNNKTSKYNQGKRRIKEENDQI